MCLWVSELEGSTVVLCLVDRMHQEIFLCSLLMSIYT